MAYIISVGDLKTHIYDEVIIEIIRGNDAIAEMAIQSAIAQAKSYLSRFDLPKLFGVNDGDDAIVKDENLSNKVKDLACWQLIRLANPSIDLALFKTAYDDAIAWFKDIQRGLADPEGWPYKPDDPETAFQEGNAVSWNSNLKRNNHF